MATLRRFLRLCSRLLLGGALLVAAGVLWLQTPWGHARVRALMVSQAQKFLSGRLEIDKIRGDLFTGVELEGVRLDGADGQVVTIAQVRVRYSAWQLARSRDVILTSLELDQPLVTLRRGSAGWNVGRLLRPRPPGTGPPRTFVVSDLTVRNGQIVFETPIGPTWLHFPRRLSGMSSRMSLHYRSGDFRVDFADFTAAGTEPDWSIKRLTGGLHVAAGTWTLARMHLNTDRSDISVDGAFTTTSPGRLELAVDGAPFDFPETAQIIPALTSIKEPAQLHTSLRGPYSAVATEVSLRSPAGDARGAMTLDMTVPGWSGKGDLDLRTFDVARWLPGAAQSDITGKIRFALDLGLGRHLPRGPYEFKGPSVEYAGYRVTAFRSTGRLTATRAEIDDAVGAAYGSPVRTKGWINLAAPFDFELAGSVEDLDLRNVPATVPVPKVDSSLSFQHTTQGRFRNPYINSRITLRAPSRFVGGLLASGTTGSLNTSVEPATYEAAGHIDALALAEVGKAFDIPTLREPRFAGTIAGDFAVRGSGLSADDISIDLTARGVRADLFKGRASLDTLEAQIAGTTLTARGAGSMTGVDLAIPSATTALGSAVTGRFALDTKLPAFFGAGTTLQDAHVGGTASLTQSTFGSLAIRTLDADATLDAGALTIRRLDAFTATGTVHASGQVAVVSGRTDLAYEVTEPQIGPWLERAGLHGDGNASSHGRATGTTDLLHLSGTINYPSLALNGIVAANGSGTYDIDVPVAAPRTLSGKITTNAETVAVASQDVGRVDVRADLTADGIQLSAHSEDREARVVDVRARADFLSEVTRLRISDLSMRQRGQALGLAADASPIVEVHPDVIRVENMTIVDLAHPESRIALQGDIGRKSAMNSVLRVTASAIDLQGISPLLPALTPYTGRLDAQFTVTGELARPTAEGTFLLKNGTFRNFKFASLTGTARREADATQVDMRLDQAPGTWLTVTGIMPDALLRSAPAVPMDLRIRSSPIDAALIEGLTTRLQEVHGTLTMDVHAVGPVDDPHFTGAVALENAAFLVAANGVRYRNGTLRLVLEPDTARFERFHLEDGDGDPLELSGSLGTHDLRLGTIGAEISATRFAVLKNEFGDVDLNGVFSVAGNPSALTLTGDVGVDQGIVDVERLLDWINSRPQPAGTIAESSVPPAGAPTTPTPLWDRLTLRLRTVATNNLRLRGNDLRLNGSSGVSVGDIDVTVGADLTLRHQPGRPLELSGELRTARGTYIFAGRRFTVGSDSTVRFSGPDATNPTLAISAHRLISGVDVGVNLDGRLAAVELDLSSSPQLDQTDILSLILFNVPQNTLATEQRNALAIQAAGLAGGVLVSPAISALGRAVGLDFLTVEPTADVYGGARVSAGRGFGARAFVTVSREFGHQTFNELMLEYDLTKFLRLRATTTDGPVGVARDALYRRLDRVGIDLIFFFSY